MDVLKCNIVKGIVVMLFLLVLVGCKNQIQYVPVKSLNIETVTLRDTVVKTVLVTYRDTVYLKGDTVSYLKNQYAESWARWIDGGLSHSLNMLPDSIPVRVIYRDVDRYREVEIPIEVEKKLTRWERTKMDVGGWAIGLLSGVLLIGVGYVIVWIVRKFR